MRIIFCIASIIFAFVGSSKAEDEHLYMEQNYGYGQYGAHTFNDSGTLSRDGDGYTYHGAFGRTCRGYDYYGTGDVKLQCDE